MIELIKQKAKRALCRLVDKEITRISQDMGYEKKLLARSESTKYVLEKMQESEVFFDKKSLMNHSIKSCANDGLICEFGVYKGDSINQISRVLPEREVHGFDSFEGLPESWRTGFEKGEFNLRRKAPRVNENVKLHIGWFDEVLPEFCNQNTQDVAFLHIDCDIYSSTKTVFNYLGDRLKPGSIIVFDEYFNYPGWQAHEYRAFREFVNEANISYEYLAYNELHEQVSVILK